MKRSSGIVLREIEFGVVPLPVDKKAVTQIITDHIVITGYSPNKKLAGEFLNFAYQRKYRLEFTKLGLVPELKSVATDDYFQKNPHWKVFVDIIPTGKVIPLIKWEKIGESIREAMYQAITGRKKVKKALDELAVTIDRLTAKIESKLKN